MSTISTSSTDQAEDQIQDRLWKAFILRDRSLDGVIVCAVSSTGIYCRPTCPARRPGRAQVSFFRSPAEARDAGFRACLRCHPDRKETDADLVKAACDFIADYLETQDTVPSNSELVAVLGISSGRLQRLFREVTGLTPAQFAKGKRLERFKAFAKDGTSVTKAVYDAGYGSSSRLYENAAKQLGMTPATYRKGGVGAVIRYTIDDSALGGILVAATTTGICSVKMGDHAETLVAELNREFPMATLLRVDPGEDEREHRDLRAWLAALREYLGGFRVDVDLPLDVLATAFQWRVWRQLQSIPAGEIRTYQQMAEALGKPAASRAVGRACATNPVAPIIPCHRAVRKDGGLAGYRWGLCRKEALLEMEQRRKGQQS